LHLLAIDYGSGNIDSSDIGLSDVNLPQIRLPVYVCRNTHPAIGDISLTDTLLRDEAVRWSPPDFVRGSTVRAVIEGDKVTIQPQPIRGDGSLFFGRYEAFRESNPEMPAAISADMVVDAISASFTNIKLLTFSAWSQLVPTLFSVFSVARPRRYVELGTHHGMSFFAACQAAEVLGLQTQCVAVDSWIGDPHASFHTDDVFEGFRTNLKNNFPSQSYIKAYFNHALACFEDGSIDLLHIDGFHTYAAVKDDFDTWLPKMSSNGIVMFHDINVHERGFGVWRLWAELKEKYPAFSLFHCHGLGIIYVGRQPSAFAEMLTLLETNQGYNAVARTFLESIGNLSVEHRNRLQDNAHREQDIARREQDVARREQDVARREHDAGAASLSENILQFWQRRAKGDDVANYRKRHRGLIDSLRRDRALQKRLQRDYCRIIEESGLFDVEFYKQYLPDATEYNGSAIEHFVRFGVYELKNPNSTFDTAGYLRNNSDVLLSCMNPFVHYIQFGRKEGRAW